MEKVMQNTRGVVFPFLLRDTSLLQAVDYFRGIENQGKNFLELFGRHPVFQQPLDHRPQGTRSIINDVAKLFVFAMDIADHMDRTSWQRGPSPKPDDRR